MKKILERIVASESAPGYYDLWVDTNNETPELKVNYGYDKNTGWKTIGGSGSGGSGGNGCSCLAPMMVEGTVATADNIVSFIPADGSPTWEEAKAYMFQGGLLYLVILVQGEPVGLALANSVSDPTTITAVLSGSDSLVWRRGNNNPIIG